MTNAGSGYTQAIVEIVNQTNGIVYSGGGVLGSARAIISGQYGSVRTYYYSTNGVKTIINGNAGTVDYLNGIITLNNFAPININNTTGVLSINIIPDSTIIKSTKNKLLTIDVDDPTSVSVNIISS